MEAPQYEIDAQRKMARQRFIDAHRDLPPADKRDTLSLRLSDFIRDLDYYEKELLKEVDCPDLADVSAKQMEQLLLEPATVEQLLEFLAKVQRQTVSVYSRSNAWRFSQELLELHPVRYLYHEGDTVYLGADKYEVSAFDETAVSLQNPEFPLFGKEMSRADFEKSSVKILPMTTSRSSLQKCRTRKHLPKQSLTVWYFLLAFQNTLPFMTGN